MFPRIATRAELAEMEREDSPVPEVPEIHEGMSLNDILACLDLHDSKVVPRTAEELQTLGRLLLRKVDAYKFNRDQLEGEADRFEGYAEVHLKESHTFRKKVKALDDRMIWAMDRNGFEKLPGEQWRVDLVIGNPLEVTREPDEKLAQEMPDFVRVTTKTSYGWKKVELKAAIGAGFHFPYGKIGRTTSPNFHTNKKDI